MNEDFLEVKVMTFQEWERINNNSKKYVRLEALVNRLLAQFWTNKKDQIATCPNTRGYSSSEPLTRAQEAFLLIAEIKELISG